MNWLNAMYKGLKDGYKRKKKRYQKKKEAPDCFLHPHFIRLFYLFGCAESFSQATVLCTRLRCISDLPPSFSLRDTSPASGQTRVEVLNC